MMELWYALVDLLPFEWADHGFMRSALLSFSLIANSSCRFLSIFHSNRSASEPLRA